MFDFLADIMQQVIETVARFTDNALVFEILEAIKAWFA